MPRIYDDLIGIPEYCAAIDADNNHSPFVGIARVRAPEELFIQAAELGALEAEGFYLVDPLGRVVEGEGGNFAAYVIAPHVAQRRFGGRFPSEAFDRRRASECGFGGDRAKRLDPAMAAGAIRKAWLAWGHAPMPLP